MTTRPDTLKLANVGYAFDHPEAVAWGPDGLAYAGGEAGQLYRFSLDGNNIEEVARVAGGFLLGIAHDAGANSYVCDDRSACVHRIAPDGQISTYANGNGEEKMRVPNYPVFDDHGNLYVSDSGAWGERDGFIWKIAPGGKAAIWDRQAPVGGRPLALCCRIKPAAHLPRRDKGGWQRRAARGCRRTAPAGSGWSRFRRGGQSLY